MRRWTLGEPSIGELSSMGLRPLKTSFGGAWSMVLRSFSSRIRSCTCSM